MKANYNPCFREGAEGYLFLGHQKKGAVTISLVGAASMPQAELDHYGEIFAEALRNSRPFEDIIFLDETK